MELTQGKWYQLPSGKWAKAGKRPGGTTLPGYSDVQALWMLDVYSGMGPDARWLNEEGLDVLADGRIVMTKGQQMQWWTVADLREATTDEAQELDYRSTFHD